MHFVDVIIRQAHPGPGARPYRSFEQKVRDAEVFKREERIPYPVVVDELAGTVHQVYGGLADPTYLIDAEGRVSFYSMWTHAPTLHEAIEELFEKGARGVVKGGYDRTPHLLPALADGWKGLRRGWPQSVIELEMSAPGMASGPWLGSRLRPLLAPIALRARPLPAPFTIALAAGASALLAVGLRSWTRNRRLRRKRQNRGVG